MSATNITTLGESITALKKSKNDSDVLVRIAKRASSLFGSRRSEMDYRFDLVCVHRGTCPLDLDRLLAAKENDFIHDIAGIARHLNHVTGELENCFVPRFAM